MTMDYDPLGSTAGSGMRFEQRLSADFFTDVQDAVRRRADQAGLDAVITDDPEDVAYLTGFFHHPCERPVAVHLPVDGDVVLLIPDLEREHAEYQGVHAALATYHEYPGITPPFAAWTESIRATRAGFTPAMRYDRLASLRSALPDTHLTVTDIIVTERMIKRPQEIALHTEAGRITDLMLAAGIEMIRDGANSGLLPSEAELASHVSAVGTRTMYREHRSVVVGQFLAGGLVYAAENSVKPHGLPSGYRVRRGDTVMLSLGCAVGGRHVEGERTFILGEPSAAQEAHYMAIEQAQAAGAAAIRPGRRCFEANEECLTVIREAGFGQFIQHRQGHGIGVGMHEPPWLESGDATIIAPGMILSNEPGIYVPGEAGYRISDSMLVTQTGAVSLIHTPRGLGSAVIDI